MLWGHFHMAKILIVDDHLANRQLLLEILKDIGQLDVACDGKEALGAYQKSIQESQPYDLILLDVAMPEIDGLELLKIVRDTEQGAGVGMGEGIPIIMITAHKEPLLDAFNSGCDDFVIKPIDGAKLLKKIKEKLEKKPMR